MAPVSTIQMLFLYIAFTPPAGVLSVQPASKTIMVEGPRPPTESIFNREILMDSFTYAFGTAVIVWWPFWYLSIHLVIMV